MTVSGLASQCVAKKRVDVGRDRSPIRKRVDVGSDRSLAFIFSGSAAVAAGQAIRRPRGPACGAVRGRGSKGVTRGRGLGALGYPKVSGRRANFAAMGGTSCTLAALGRFEGRPWPYPGLGIEILWSLQTGF